MRDLRRMHAEKFPPITPMDANMRADSGAPRRPSASRRLSRSTVERLRAFLILSFALLGLSSCSMWAGRQQTCAPIALRDGKQVTLTRAEFAQIAPELSVYLAERGLNLVSDITGAERLVTIAYEPNPAKPGTGTLHVIDLASNTFRPIVGTRSEPYDLSISASNDGAVNRAQVGFPLPDQPENKLH